jgi:cytochrome c oxidase subunit 3
MSARRTLDVSRLPAHAFGLRSALVWGALLAICIEGTVMALSAVTFLYLRGNYQVWPPTGVGPAAFDLAAVQMGFLLVSALPTVLMNRAAVRERYGTARLWLVVVTVLSLVVTVLRGFELPRIGFRWDQHAYGSAFWLTLGVHITHLLSGVAEFLLLVALMTVGKHRFEKKHFTDVEAAGQLWIFVVVEWAIVYPVLYLLPLTVRR